MFKRFDFVQCLAVVYNYTSNYGTKEYHGSTDFKFSEMIVKPNEVAESRYQGIDNSILRRNVH